jgi:hypothetical protein
MKLADMPQKENHTHEWRFAPAMGVFAPRYVCSCSMMVKAEYITE